MTRASDISGTAGIDDIVFTPKVGINFEQSGQVMIYASATRGFKSGGYDHGANNAIDSAARYDPEKLWSNQGGLKLLNGRLRLNLTGVYYVSADLNVQSYVQIGASLGARPENTATARLEGIGAEIAPRPDRDLDASSNQLSNAPQRSATFRAVYEVNLNASGAIYLSVDPHVQLRLFFRSANDGMVALTTCPKQQKSYGVVNNRIGWAEESGKLKVQVIGTNLFDRNYIVSPANYTPAIAGRQGQPRQVSGRISEGF